MLRILKPPEYIHRIQQKVKSLAFLTIYRILRSVVILRNANKIIQINQEDIMVDFDKQFSLAFPDPEQTGGDDDDDTGG